MPPILSGQAADAGEHQRTLAEKEKPARGNAHAGYEGLAEEISLDFRQLEHLKNVVLAEREGFEPSVRLPVRLISSQVHSTTLPPLRRVA
jgi:hypothetical protein